MTENDLNKLYQERVEEIAALRALVRAAWRDSDTRAKLTPSA